MSVWNYANVWETIAGAQPGAPAQVQGDRRFTWEEFDARADGVAAALLEPAVGAAKQATVAQYLYSCPEYLESVFACFKSGLAPVNTNYRYIEDELVYLWGNAGCVAVVFQGSFADRIEHIRERVSHVRLWLWVDDGSGPCPSWAHPYEVAAAGGMAGRQRAGAWGRSPDDLYLLYTGGTTGMPKGVMWRQDDLFVLMNRSGRLRYPEDGGVADIAPRLGRSPHPSPIYVPCAPLMHGTGAMAAFSTLASGGCIVTLEGRSFSAPEFLNTVQRERVTETAIVGDAFAKPILRELDAHDGRWDLASLWLMQSSGVMWGAETKVGLVRHIPRLLCVDSLGSSEAIGMASSISSRKHTAGTAGFQLGESTRVITEDGRDVVAGSGERGLVALRGRGPIGYFGDPVKSAATFQVIDGERWSIPGDWAEVSAEGELKLLGRGSNCINTGGEKVFPEEVEEVLKTYPSVLDAVAVGVPDERFGEAIVALVQIRAGSTVAEVEVIAHVKSHLAHYKAPKRVFTIETIGRAPNGKVDYKRLKNLAEEKIALRA